MKTIKIINNRNWITTLKKNEDSKTKGGKQLEDIKILSNKEKEHMIKFRVRLLGNQISQGEWKETFDSYEEAKEYGDFLVDCRRLFNVHDEETFRENKMDPKDRPIPYLIIAEEQQDDPNNNSSEN